MPWSAHRKVISRVATITALTALLLLAAGCTGRSASSDDGSLSAANPAQGGTTPDVPASTTAKAAAQPSAVTSPPPPPVKPLPKEVARVINLANSTMTGGTFAATYRLTQQYEGSVRSSRLVQKGVRYRFEHALEDGLRGVIVYDGKLVYDCRGLQGSPMKCQSAANPVFDQATFGPAHPSMLLSQIESMNVFIGRGMTATTAKRTVLGMPLRCVVFQSTFEGAPKREACMTEQGVIAYVHIDATRLVMTGFTTRVSDSEFLPPR
jgi:hypothetical protein